MTQQSSEVEKVEVVDECNDEKVDESINQSNDHSTDQSNDHPTDHSSSQPKSKNQLKNEAKRREKAEKFAAKTLKKLEEEAKAAEKRQKAIVSSFSHSSTPQQQEASTTGVEPGKKKQMSSPMASCYSPIAVEASWYEWWEGEGFFKPESNEIVNGGLNEALNENFNEAVNENFNETVNANHCSNQTANSIFNSQSNHISQSPSPFVVAIPPPNVTGSLHLGHSMMASIQDAIVRFKRMQGKPTLYVPGCDHAGIATQVVVEKKLKKEHNILRHELGREKFIEQVWQWKCASGGRIYTQLKRMGISADWSRACFTMDDKFVTAVNEAFLRLHREGLIFRDNRLVNWSAKIQTALSDLEVDSLEIAGVTRMRALHGHDPQKEYTFGLLYSFAYPLADDDDDGEIVVATTRPETIFGDVAVAVSPQDSRYAHLRGKFVIHPFKRDLRLPIIFDSYVDPEFGTGAVKITPAHDANDFRLGKAHKLPFINVFDDDNALNGECGSFAGMKRFDAREAVVEALKEKGLYRGESSHSCILPICSRSGDIVEPRLKPQWWLNCKEMARKACQVVKDGELEIIPSEGEREWFKWLEGIQDWCLSRQLWWGHRIPVWHVDFCCEGEESAKAESAKAESAKHQNHNLPIIKKNPDSEEFWICAASKEEALEQAKRKFPSQRLILTQDEDVLDTWFSSGLWPFGIFGWPNDEEQQQQQQEKGDFSKYFPTSLLETGKDILFFWVARMVMLSIQLTGKVPFKQILLHSIVRDAHGRKMSKSLGNVVDPIDVIEGITLEGLQEQLEKGNLDPKEIRIAKEGQKKDFPKGIPQCGTDALRFCLLACTNQSRDVNLDIQRVEGYRKFCNKIWNATRFCLAKFADWQPLSHSAYHRITGKERPVDFWILQKLSCTIEKVTFNLEKYNFIAATSAIHSFWLYDLCDVYIEACKPAFDEAAISNFGLVEAQEVSRAVLYECFDCALRLLHPFMPYVTEELWQRLPRRPGKQPPSIMVSPFPRVQPEWCTQSYQQEALKFERVIQLVERIRSIAPSCIGTVKKVSCATLKVVVAVGEEQVAEKERLLLESEKPTILALAKMIGDLKIVSQSDVDSGEGNYRVLEDCGAEIRFE